MPFFFLFQLFQPVIKLARGEAEHLGGLGFVAPAVGQRFFDFFQRMGIGLEVRPCLVALNGEAGVFGAFGRAWGRRRERVCLIVG